MVFNVAKVPGMFDHCGPIDVKVVQGEKRDPFAVVLSKHAGGMSLNFALTPDQSRDLRKALEDAEAKAEILTAAI